MKIDETLMKQIAALAAIEMDPVEMEAQKQDLERIAAFTGSLTDLDTNDMVAQTHPFSLNGKPGISAGNHLREDIVTNEDCAEGFVAAAPDSKGLYFRTPRTVEE